jgi:hypothetical protein
VQAAGSLLLQLCSILIEHANRRVDGEVWEEIMSSTTALLVALEAGGAAASQPGTPSPAALAQDALRSALLGARKLADALLAWQQRPEQLEAERLELAQAQALRSCAYLRCPNVGAGGGMMAGQGGGGKLCSGCRVAWYCDTACSHADWRAGGHKRACAALGAARPLEQQQARSSA